MDNDLKPKPILVQCPYSHQVIDVEPLLRAVHKYFDNFGYVAERLSMLFEDVSSFSDGLMYYEPDELAEHIGYLRQLRRGFTEMSMNIKTHNNEKK